jgi:hypothetical protein
LSALPAAIVGPKRLAASSTCGYRRLDAVQVRRSAAIS